MTIQYKFDVRDEFASCPSIPATITEIRDGDGDDMLDVAARFPGRHDLEDLGFFTVRLHGDALDVVSISYYEPTAGAFDSLPMGNATKGVFEALTSEYRANLDTLRETLLADRTVTENVERIYSGAHNSLTNCDSQPVTMTITMHPGATLMMTGKVEFVPVTEKVVS